MLRSVSLIVLLAACGDPPPSAAPAPAATLAAAPAAPTLSPWPARSLTLESPGQPPLEPIRMPLGPAAQRLRFGSSAAVDGTLGGAPVDGVRLQSERTLRIEVAPGADSVRRGLQFTVERYHDDAGLPADEQAVIDTALTGLRGAWTDDARCVVLEAGAVPVPAPADRLQSAILNGVVDLCPSLPEQAVGVGARWTTTVGGATPGEEREQTTWTLLERGPGRVVLTFETRAERTSADGQQRVNLGEGRVELRSGLPLPWRADARGRATRTSATAGQPLTTTTEWTMFVETVEPEAKAAPAAHAEQMRPRSDEDEAEGEE